MRTGRWSTEEESYLRWVYGQALPVEWAAKHLDRTLDAVKQKASRLGLQHPRFGRAPGPRDLATVLARLQGLEPPAGDAPIEPLTEEALRGFVDDPEALFAWLGVGLFRYQPEGLGLIQGGDRTALVWGRQTGKDLYPALLEDLAWLRDHHRAGPDHYVFRNPNQKYAAFRQWFDTRLKKYARKSGHPTYVHPHLVRASSATDQSERGVPDRDIMLQGDWRSLSSLRKYLRVNDEARRGRMQGGLDL